jgi:hypothetical protein
MNTKAKIAVLALLLGTSMAATAQTPSRSQTFAEQFREMQRLSTNTASTYTNQLPPVLSNAAQDPVGNESFSRRFADMQAESSNSSNFEPQPRLTAIAADPVGHESFAAEFARMQAASSNSGEFGFHPGADVPASLANNTNVQGRSPGSATGSNAGSAARADVAATRK